MDIIVGDKYRFETLTDTELGVRNGQICVVEEAITAPTPEFDAEVLPMWNIRFPDGESYAVWGDELGPDPEVATHERFTP